MWLGPSFNLYYLAFNFTYRHLYYLIIQESICFLTSWENVRPCVPYVVKFRHCARSVGRGPRAARVPFG